MNLPGSSRVHATAVVAVTANVVPLLGVAFWGWDLFTLLFLYWLESAVVGAYNIAKILYKNPVKGTFLVPVFLLHYGSFMTGHLVFLYKLFAPEELSGSILPSGEAFASQLLTVWPALMTLVISHGISFVKNFLGEREYEKMNLEELMGAPYRRILLMQVVVVAGAGLITILNAPIIGLVLLIVLKTAADVEAHIKEHK